jgi:hypothetical protein
MSDRTTSTVVPNRNNTQEKQNENEFFETSDQELATEREITHTSWRPDQTGIFPTVMFVRTTARRERGLSRWLSKIGGILVGTKARPASQKLASSVESSEHNLIVERALGEDTEEITPLRSLQFTIEQINLEADNQLKFQVSLAYQLFFRPGKTSIEEVEELWEISREKKLIKEIYSLINSAKKAGRPLAFREAFNQVYANKRDRERKVLDDIAKILISNH